MEFKMNPYIVYVKCNDYGQITAVNSSAFLHDTAGWTEIDSGFANRYHHAQGNYFPQPICTPDGAYRYKLEVNAAVECTEEEIAAQTQEVCNITHKSIEERVNMLEESAFEMTNMLRSILEKTLQ